MLERKKQYNILHCVRGIQTYYTLYGQYALETSYSAHLSNYDLEDIYHAYDFWLLYQCLPKKHISCPKSPKSVLKEN